MTLTKEQAQACLDDAERRLYPARRIWKPVPLDVDASIVYPPEIGVTIEAGISDVMMGTMREAVREACVTGLSVSRIELADFYADDPEPRTRQFPEHHRYDAIVAMSKLEDV